MRIFLALGFLIGLAGCVAPPALTIATLAFDGFSYLTTGKGVGDHALSYATQQDCAMWRVLKEQALTALCRDNDGADGVTTVAAASPGFTDGDGQVPAAPTIRPAAPTLQPAAFGLTGEQPIQALSTAPANDQATYLVVGSFRQLDNAKQRVARLTGTAVRVTAVAVGGEVFHRVVAGPFTEKGMAAARLRIADAGVTRAWGINLCTADLAAPPCAVPRSPAGRPEPLNMASNDAAPNQAGD